MRAKVLASTVALLLSPFYAALALPISSINQIVSFGDSLSDNGNAYYLENAYKSIFGTLPPGEPYPAPPEYTTGKFTNGPDTTPGTAAPTGLWVDQLSTKLNVSDPQPFLSTGGNNYATGSAEAGHNPAVPLGVPYLDDQVGEFNVAHLGSAPSGALYTFWIGADNIFAGGNPVTAADDVFSNIEDLAGEGAKYFLWLNLPALGDTPVGSGNSAVLNAASSAFDAEWSVDIAKLQSQGIDVIGVDVATLFSDILANPSNYGFSNTNGAAWCGPGALPNCASNNPNQFVFWDGEHPTTAADALVADLAFSDIAAPEPLSAGLAFLGLFGLLAIRKRANASNRFAHDSGSRTR